MIFAAGLGTRLKPLTNSTPKALVKIHGKPMLEWTILRLKQFNVREIIINVHHFSDQVIDFLQSKNNFGIHIEISHEQELLDTGGGLKKAAWFFSDADTVLLHNCDVLSTIDLNKMYEQHIKSNADATLAVRTRKTNRYLLFDTSNKLVGWKSKKEQKTIWVNKPVINSRELSFCGIHIISVNFLEYLSNQIKIPIIEEYLRLANMFNIYAFNSNEYDWLDLGRKESINLATDILDSSYFLDLEKFYS